MPAPTSTMGCSEGYKTVIVGGRSHRAMDPEQRPTLKLILKLFNDGMSWSEIRNHMNNVACIPMRNGSKWRYSALVNAATNELKFQYTEIHAGDWGREPAGKAHNTSRENYRGRKDDYGDD